MSCMETLRMMTGKQEEVARLKAEQGISDMEEPALNTELDGFEVESF